MRRRSRSVVGGVAVAIAATLILSACSSSKSSSSSSGSASGSAVNFTGSPVVIGQEVCQTGYLASSDAYLAAGAKIAVDLLNAKGGILGHKVELQTKDTQCVASNEIQLANSFISQTHVNAIIGGFQSAAITGVIPVVKAASVPFIGAGTLPLQSDWGITTFPPNSYVPATFLDYMTKNKGVKSLGNITGDTPFGQAVQALVDTAAKTAGVSTKDVQIANAATSTTPVLQQMSSTDAIFTNTSGPINIIFSKDAQTLGLKKPLIFNDTLSDCTQAAANYTPVYCVILQPGVYPNIPDPTIKANETALYSIYKGNGGQLTNFAGVTAGADQVNLLAKAMTTANSTDGATVQKSLANVEYVGAQAAYKYTAGNTFGVTANAYILTTATSSGLTVVSTSSSSASPTGS
jgi:ABC-type branched-subunit amino acid transport system substrate-binding protein